MAAQRKIDIRYGSLFPWPFQVMAGIILLIAISLILERTIMSLVLIGICGSILSASEGTEIDIDGKDYVEYTSFLFFIKSGTREKFLGMEKVFINTSKTKQQFYTAHTTKSSIFENIEYNAFLKFDDGRKVHLLQKRRKEALLTKINKIATILEVPVEDHTVVAS
jgi:hypothetical protein